MPLPIFARPRISEFSEITRSTSFSVFPSGNTAEFPPWLRSTSRVAATLSGTSNFKDVLCFFATQLLVVSSGGDLFFTATMLTSLVAPSCVVLFTPDVTGVSVSPLPDADSVTLPSFLSTDGSDFKDSL